MTISFAIPPPFNGSRSPPGWDSPIYLPSPPEEPAAFFVFLVVLAIIVSMALSWNKSQPFAPRAETTPLLGAELLPPSYDPGTFHHRAELPVHTQPPTHDHHPPPVGHSAPPAHQ